MAVTQEAVEMEQANMILNQTGYKNLMLLREHMPQLYEKFRNYTPEKIHLCIDDSNAINLAENNTRLVYPNNPRPQVMEQVKLYKSMPKVFVYQPEVSGKTKSPLAPKHFLHAHHLNHFWELRYENSDIPTLGQQLPSVVPMLVIVGIGLGYHLEELVRTENIRNLFIYEPDMDIFYAFLHVIDLTPIFEKTIRDHGTITFQVGSSTGHFVNAVSEFLWNRGHFHSARLYYYCHYRSEAANEATEKMHNLINRTMQGWGFFEDELVGIAHSLLNIDNKHPLIKKTKHIEEARHQVPAIIVGNGPSLDDNIARIKELAGQCVIFSCGSALSPLHQHGIVPDFHVEIERTAFVEPWLDLIDDTEFFDQITLITMNTVHPKVLSRFKNNIQTLKLNDVGAELIYEALESDLADKPEHSNPTAVNGGVAFSIALGFAELYLFGVDFGFKDSSYHHSKSSQYYNPKNKGAFGSKGRGDRTYEGNFSDEILSNDLFDYARFEVERALNDNPHITCFNCSDGIKIFKTRPLKAHKIRITTETADKQNCLKTIQQEHLVRLPEDIPERAYERYQIKSKEINELMNHFIRLMDRPVTSIEELLNIFSEQKAFLTPLRQQVNIIFTMCSGTMNYFQGIIASYALDHKDPEEAVKFINKALPFFIYHLKCLLYMESILYKTGHGDYKPIEVIQSFEAYE